MPSITPFLWFDGNAEEAMKFYCAVFKDSKSGSVMRGPDGKAFSVLWFSVGFLLILGTGVALGVLEAWWQVAWFWIALVLLFVIAGVMTPLVGIPYGKVRRGLGLPVPFEGKRAAARPSRPTAKLGEIPAS